MKKRGHHVNFSKYKIRTCNSLHVCEICGKNIMYGGKYHDGGHGRRVHVECITAKHPQQGPPQPPMDHAKYWRMNLTLKEIAKKKGISYSGASRKMRNKKPVSGGYKRRYSEESVAAAFKNEEKEVVEVVERKYNCIKYSECLMTAAKLDLKATPCADCDLGAKPMKVKTGVKSGSVVEAVKIVRAVVCAG